MSLSEAILAFQKSAPDLRHDSENPHFHARFLSLPGLFAKVLPIANEKGLVIQQWPTHVRNGESLKPALRTRITHAESGEFVEDVMLLFATKEDPQAQGSALTYARRYSLMAALGLVADEDDDGNAAAPRHSGAVGNAPSPENPAEKAHQVYLEKAEHSMAQGTLPSEVMIHFGKNKDVTLGELSKAQLRWYAEDWKVQDDPTPFDARLKMAAKALHAGNDSPDFEIPF